MKHLTLLLSIYALSFASLNDITSFQADFTQSVTDEKQKVLKYNGSVLASKPQNALWRYTNPITKDVYINSDTITIIEPEIEQVLIKHIQSNFDFFNLIKNAKKIKENTYTAKYQNSEFTITTNNSIIQDISYIDEFENIVKITFSNQRQNEKLTDVIFHPEIPVEYDIIREN